MQLRHLLGSAAVIGISAVLAVKAAEAQSSTENYEYDALGRLITVVTTGGQNNNETHSICYDEAGNRTEYLSDASGIPSICTSGSGGGSTPSSLSIGNTSVTEGGTLSFTVTRSAPTAAAVNVNYTTSNGSAVAGSDYTAKSGTLSFASGETSKVITVASIDDSADESDETMQVTLSSPSSNATITNAVGTGTINDNDEPQSPLSIGNASATEGGTLSFTVTRSAPTNTAVSVNYATGNISAVAGSDYTAKSGTLSFASGETSKVITVASIDDSSSEGTETMQVTLSSPSSNAMITNAVGTGTINDNDDPPSTLSIGNASVAEGGTLSFTVTRSAPTTTAVSASYSTANGSAVAGSDYTAKSGTVSFAANETSKTVTVSTINDSLIESSETLTVTLSSPSSGAVIGTATGTGTITDNDQATISIGNTSVAEGGVLSFAVTRSGALASAVSASYATANGTAVAGSDYTAKSGTVSFAANETSKAVTVSTIDDSAYESNETLTVTLSSPSTGTVIGTATGTGTITNNDDPPNNPPVANYDSTSVTCWQIKTVNLTSNDTDPDGDLPLTITGLQLVSGTASAEVVSASSVSVTGAEEPGLTHYTYTITDSRGATATSTLDITTTYAGTCFL